MGRFYYSQKIIEYFAPVLLCIGIIIWCLKIYNNADLHIPFNYWGDSLYFYALTKTIIENGWVWQNNNLGAPYGLENFDYPCFSILDCLGIKFLSFTSSNPIFVENLYYLLTYPLTTLASMVVFRQFNIKCAYSVLGSILFAFMPYHFLRGVAHFNLSSYYILPLMIMLLLWIYSNEFASLKSDNIFALNRLLLDRKLLASAVICVLSGLVFIYYSYIFCLFLLLTGVLSSAKSWRKGPIFISFLFIMIVSATIILNFAPVLLYHHQNGPNPEDVGVRNPADTEIFGLKIIQLLLPINGHRIPIFSRITQYYDNTAPLVNDNSFASLGVIAGLGFIILIVFVFLRSYGVLNKLNYDLAILNDLSILNLFSILFAAIGGFSTIIAYAILPQFRAINRISIFIAFFSVFSILIILNYISKLHNIKRSAYLIAGLLLVFGILDQTSNSLVPSYFSIKEEYMSDDNFVKKIEATMPKDAMIFQLPYVPYPQYPPVNKLTEYSLFKGYLHSDDLRWSYGAMQGREGDQLYRLISSMPLREMLGALALEGFEGIYIDSFGYPDGGSELISNLSEILKISPLVSENQRLYFFDMNEYANRNGTAFAEKLNPSVAFGSGFHGQESWSGVPTRWMESDANLVTFSLDNYTANLTFRASSFNRPRTLEIYAGDKLAARVEVPVVVPTGFIDVTTSIELAKGSNTVKLHVPEGCQRPRDINGLNNPDSRCLSIAVQNVTVTV